MESLTKYQTWTKAELVETLKARGYKRVSTRLCKGLLVSLLARDDEGLVSERYW